MTREEFERLYAYRYMRLSFMHNQDDAVNAVCQMRDGDTYTDTHMAECWSDQQAGRDW